MEESEQRRERLRAMRNEASAAEESPSFESPAGTIGLANPLIETPVGQESSKMPRFDYYTDPMAAFSGNKRQTSFSQSSRHIPMSHGHGPRSPVMQLPPPPPFGPGNPQLMYQSNYADQRMQNPGNPELMYQSNYADQRMQNPGRPPYYGPGPVRSPMPMYNPRPEHQHHGFSNQHHIPGYNRPVNWVNSGSTTTNPGHGGPPFTNPGRASGRSTGQWTNNSPSPSGGRGIGYRGNTSPANFYRKSMVEDPWKDLKPVVWRGVSSVRIFEKFRNSSSSSKKPRVEEESNVSSSKESLADYLAASFDEAVEEGE